MVAVNSLLYFLLTAGLSGNPEEPQDDRSFDALNGIDIGKLCPPKEHLSECEAHCQKNCTNYNKPIICPRICVKGCVCDEGLVRASDGKCILPKQCPGKDTCPRGEHYVQCNAHCQWNCTTYGKPIACPRICVHGCVCDRGTVRGPRGRCIKPDSCPKKGSSEVLDEPIDVPESFCPVNEVHSKCLAHCQRDCSNWDDETFTCTKMCSPGCVCERGLVRGPDGTCIQPRECAPKEEEDSVTQERCPRHEKYSPCTAHCQKDCKNYKEVIPCTRDCNPGCVCQDDMVRGPDGKCIYPNDCPWIWEEEPAVPEAGRRCPPKEHLSECNAHCQKNCTNFNKPIVCPAICVKGCVCDKGLVRSKDGKCVPPKQCPGKDVCPRGEHYDQCNAHCQRNCSTWGKPLPCPLKCEHGCVCDRGTVRGPKGKCIRPDKCPKKDRISTESEEDGVGIIEAAAEFCPENEEYSPCDALCEGNCIDSKPHCIKICASGCKCKRGFVRGPEGKCIKEGECRSKEYPRIKVCPEGEVYDMCRAICQANCTNVLRPTPCPFVCIPGCICKRGLIRGDDGKCIPRNQCPKPRSDDGVSQEESTRIYETSEEEDSTRLDTAWMETKDEEESTLAAANFCPPNEEYSPCEAHCENNCRNTDHQPPCTRLCASGCRCKRGFVRGPKGTCVRKEECTSKVPSRTRVCPVNEVFRVCGGICQRNCSNMAKPLPCPAICIPGCQCIKGLIRGDDGKCIPRDQCLFSGLQSREEASQEDSTRWDEELIQNQEESIQEERCPRHEKYSPCTAHCQKDCKNYKEVIPCTRDCNPGCVCQDDMVRGPDGKCIYPNDCPWIWEEEPAVPEAGKRCPPKEHLSECNAHCQKNCTNFNKPIVCPAICVKGCVCDKGLVRSKDGKCVPPKQCPGKDICPRGEHYDQCNAHCQRNCSTWGKPLPCPLKCEHGCVCDRGTVRGPKGKCIRPDKCPKKDRSSVESEEDGVGISEVSV